MIFKGCPAQLRQNRRHRTECSYEISVVLDNNIDIACSKDKFKGGGWMTKKSIILASLILPGLILSLFSCHGDNEWPNGPVDPEEEHLFYIGAKVGNLVKVFSVEQEKFIDSFFVESLTENDTILYMQVIGDDSLLAFSTSSLTTVIEIDSRNILETFSTKYAKFSRDSRYYTGVEYNPLRNVICTYPGHVLINDAVEGMFYSFDNESKCLALSKPFVENGQEKCEITLFDLTNNTSTVRPNLLNGSYIGAFLLYPLYDGGKVFYGGAAYYSIFLAVTAFEADTIRIIKPFTQGHVMPLVSPDNKHLYFSLIVSEVWGEIPDRNIYVYDISTEDSIAVIPVEGMPQAASLTMTDDCKYLMAGPVHEPMSATTTTVCLIDAQDHSVLGVYDFHGLPGCIVSKRAAQIRGSF
jgi:hypothetical protein